jgi:hypothetical protein
MKIDVLRRTCDCVHYEQVQLSCDEMAAGAQGEEVSICHLRFSTAPDESRYPNLTEVHVTRVPLNVEVATCLTQRGTQKRLKRNISQDTKLLKALYGGHSDSSFSTYRE